MSDQDHNPGGRPLLASRPRPEDYRQPYPADEAYDEGPPRRRAPAANGAPRRRREPRPIGLVPLLWAVIGLLVVISGGLIAAIAMGAFTPKPARVAAAPQSQQPARPQSPAPPARPQLQITKQATYGDWIYTCVKAPTGGETRCAISQQLSDAKTKQPLFMWRIAQDGKGGLVGEWETRSGVLVDRGIVMETGTEKPVTIPFQACLPQACTAVAKLTPEVIAAIGKAQSASATVFPAGGKPVKLGLSVKGLSDALAALQQAQPQAPTPSTTAPATPAKPTK